MSDLWPNRASGSNLPSEVCVDCDKETGRAGKGEDSHYAGDFGPYCDDCWEDLREVLQDSLVAANKKIEELEKLLKPLAKLYENEVVKKGGDTVLWLVGGNTSHGIGGNEIRHAHEYFRIKNEGWQPASTAPKDGTKMTVLYVSGDTEDNVYWQNEGRHCMLGPRNGSYPPGFTSTNAGNLPVDEVTHWKPMK